MIVDLPRGRWVRESPYGRRPSSSSSSDSLDSPTIPPPSPEVTRPLPCYPRLPLHDVVALTGSRVGLVHAARMNMTADLGQYVTVMMDMCYRAACVSLFLCSQENLRRRRGRQVPVRTLQ